MERAPERSPLIRWKEYLCWLSTQYGWQLKPSFYGMWPYPKGEKWIFLRSALPRASKEPTYAGNETRDEDRNLYFVCCIFMASVHWAALPAYVVLYPTLYAGHHFICHLPGKDCTQNLCTSSSLVSPFVASFVVTWWLLYIVIENGKLRRDRYHR